MSSFDLIFKDFDKLFDCGPAFVKRDCLTEPLKINFAGYSKEDLDICLRNGYLKIVAENKEMGKCDYAVFVGNEYDEDNIIATMKNGLLTIDVKIGAKKRKKIEIK